MFFYLNKINKDNLYNYINVTKIESINSAVNIRLTILIKKQITIFNQSGFFDYYQMLFF